MNNKILSCETRDALTEHRLPTCAMKPLEVEKEGEWDCSEEEIRARASTVTAVLEEILSANHAFPHGGINE